tara:strand:+ start:123 stop:626 length:504 start_codon:yes stop_codon:yes gene_type:complete
MALKELIGEGINFLNRTRSDSSLTPAERLQMDSIWESQEAEDIIKKTALEADGWSGEKNDAGAWEYTKTLTEKQKRDRDSAVLQEFSAPEEGGYDKALTTREPPRLARPSEPRQLGYRDTEVPNPVTTYMQPRFQNSAAYDQRAKEQIAGLLASPKISSVLGKLLLG